jgi:hypothetical protein
MRKLLLASALLLLSFSADAQTLGKGKSGQVVANPTAADANAAWSTPHAWLDRWCSSTPGNIMVRGPAASWVCAAVSGDATLSSAAALTLATVNSNVGAFGSSTNCVTLTVNAKGLITAASQTACAFPVTSVYGRTGAVTAQADDHANFDGLALKNCTLAGAVAGNNLTISLVDFQGNTPSSTSPCVIVFRDATAATGTTVSRTVTAASTVVFNSGSTLGTTNNVPFKLWVEAFDTGSGVALAASLQSNATTVFPFDEHSVKSSTACNACTNATSAGVFYSTAAQTSKPWRILGFMEWGSGLATAGTWASGPTKIQLFGIGISRPGQPVPNSVQFQTQSTTTISTVGYTDTACTASITPTMASNYVYTDWNGETQVETASNTGQTALRRSGTVVGQPKTLFSAAANIISSNGQRYIDAPGTTGSITYTVAGKVTAGNLFFPNGAGGCVLILSEIMG